ncbi:hypothetical protein AB0A74_10460 [Saccharothrix sp. NPDC042600]|uniref:hypothetical protein n=1 Tax=Saccharothrix TaxID=2071 RepID=UPI0033D01EB2
MDHRRRRRSPRRLGRADRGGARRLPVHGSKAALRPVYDRVAVLALGLGEDVRLEGRST